MTIMEVHPLPTLALQTDALALYCNVSKDEILDRIIRSMVTGENHHLATKGSKCAEDNASVPDKAPSLAKPKQAKTASKEDNIRACGSMPYEPKITHEKEKAKEKKNQEPPHAQPKNLRSWAGDLHIQEKRLAKMAEELQAIVEDMALFKNHDFNGDLRTQHARERDIAFRICEAYVNGQDMRFLQLVADELDLDFLMRRGKDLTVEELNAALADALKTS